MTKPARLFDKRVVDRNLDKGLITHEDINEYLASLPDMEHESELLLVDSEEEAETSAEAEETETENSSYNFEAPENEGPKNVYDF